MNSRIYVVGAGTSGLIAAKRLAAYGFDVEVYDQKRILGSPARASGILSIKGLGSLGIDYDEAITNTLYGANLHAGKKTFRIRSNNPIAYVLDRKKLNQICCDEAIKAGAKVHTNSRVDGKLLNELHRQGIIIGADGAISTVAKRFSMGSIKEMVLTYKAEYSVDVGEKEMVDLYFDNKAYRGLFAWTCPNASNILELGVGVASWSGNARKAYGHFINSGEIKKIIENKKLIDEGASIIPIGLRHKIVDNEKRVMLVGDAAGQVKATTGGGIIFGGRAAILAADVIKEHAEMGVSLGVYKKRFMKSCGLDLSLHNAFSLYKSIDARYLGFMFSAMDAIGIGAFLGKYGDMDLPSVTLKRFFLRGLVD